MVDITERKRLLSVTELFAPLDEATMRIIAGFCSVYRYRKGKTVFRAGDPSIALYIVRTGEIAISRPDEQGVSQEIARMVAGDSFGDLDLMTGTARNAEAKAAEDSELLQFPGKGKRFEDLLASHPEVGARLLHSFLKVTAGKIRNANALLKDNSPWVQELRNQVYGDKLTGLYNRTFLEERLPDYLKDPKKPVGLLMVKPDNFKHINDTYGHEAGDQALVVMAGKLKKHLPETAVAVRFMGNELSALIPGADRIAAMEAAKGIHEMMTGLDFSQQTAGNPFKLSMSIGIAVFPDHAQKAADLIAKAHELPLVGRERGGNKILFPEDK